MQTNTQSQVQPEERAKAQMWNIIIFELAGTFLLVYGSLSCEGKSYGIALIYFVCLVLFGRISGGHFNPVITTMMYINGEVGAKNAMYYVLPQFLASFFAAMIAIPILHLTKGPYIEPAPSSMVFGTFIAELLGSMIFFLFVCVQMNKRTQISTSLVVSSIFICVVFFIAREFTITMSNSLFNPAAAVGLEVFYGIYFGDWNQWINLINYITAPWLGSLLAMTFYQKVYLKTLLGKEQ